MGQLNELGTAGVSNHRIGRDIFKTRVEEFPVAHASGVGVGVCRALEAGHRLMPTEDHSRRTLLPADGTSAATQGRVAVRVAVATQCSWTSET